jgi:lipopolysaccharide/colanic/teichoic acid biosynthesis glycosyltransferase
MTPPQRAVKRAVDVVIAAGALLLVLPVMLLIAVAIKLESRGPVFYQQRRVGEGGRIFKMLRFRSMVINAESLQVTLMHNRSSLAVRKQNDGALVTHVGALLRAMHLDELPQLLNVLRGDMSLVGPRPEVPWLVERYEEWERERLTMPQGITGWWQVAGATNKASERSVQDDLHYVRNYSLWLDLKIMLMTIPALFKRLWK